MKKVMIDLRLILFLIELLIMSVNAESRDWGAVIIPKDIFPEGNGLPFPIYVPSVINNSNAYTNNGWERVKEISRENMKFNYKEALRNIIQTSPPRPPEGPGINVGPGAAISLGSTIVLACERALERDGFKITIQRNPQGDFRAIIEILMDEGNVLRENAGGVISSPDSGIGAMAFSQYLQERFSLPDSFFLYQGFWIIDKKHKEDLYVAYLSLCPDKNALVITPKIYPDDEFKIMKIITPFGGPTVLELKSERYLKEWTCFLTAPESQPLKVLELISNVAKIASGSGKILFIGGFRNLFSIDPESLEKTEVLPDILSHYTGDGRLYHLTVSSDGKKIAFPIYPNLENRFATGIAVIEVEKGKQRNLLIHPPLPSIDPKTVILSKPTRGAGMRHLRWSPNGKIIAFEGVRGGNTSIYVINVDTRSSLLQLTSLPSYSPSWSPDNRKIVFESYILERDPEYSNIYITNITSISQRKLTSGIAPEWSPGGGKLAFVSPEKKLCIGKLENVEIKEIKQIPLNLDVSNIRQIRWSPDEKKIIFSDGQKIFTVDIDGKNLKEIYQSQNWLIDWVADFPLK